MHPKVLLIRHGQTAFNRQGLVHGRADTTGLDDMGKAQVANLVPVCKAHQVKLLMSSPEIRALETAEILAVSLDLQIRQVEALRERDWGQWSGEPWEQIHGRLKPMSLEERFTFVPPDGESWQQMEQRLLRCAQQWQGLSESVAVVAHGGLLRALIPLLLEKPRETSFQYDLANASVSIFEVKGKRFNLLCLNDVDHLQTDAANEMN
jgi:broad specificity phosphatase PhoE